MVHCVASASNVNVGLNENEQLVGAIVAAVCLSREPTIPPDIIWYVDHKYMHYPHIISNAIL